jgi:hypothetical protein
MSKSSHARRARLLSLAVVVLAALAAVVAGSAAAGTRHHHHPKLSLVRTHPLTVSGRGFVARREVVVTLKSAQTVSRRVTASRRGTFTVSFAATAVDRCSGWTVSAQQTHHATAVLRGPKPQCAPAATP